MFFALRYPYGTLPIKSMFQSLFKPICMDKELRKEILEVLESYFGKVNDLHRNIFDVCDVAAYLRISISYVRKLTPNKEIPHHKPTGKKLFFVKEEIDEWVRNSGRIG